MYLDLAISALLKRMGHIRLGLIFAHFNDSIRFYQAPSGKKEHVRIPGTAGTVTVTIYEPAAPSGRLRSARSGSSP